MNSLRKILNFIAIVVIGAWAIVLIVLGSLAMGENPVGQETIVTTILGLLGFTSLVLIVLIFYLQSIRSKLMEEEAEYNAAKGIEEVPSAWSNLMAKLTRAVPVEQEKDILLDHNYDGIRELDNHLPPWWTWLFNLSIVFGVVYLLVYHVFQIAPLQIEEYENEMADAAATIQARQAAMVASGDAFDESSITFTDDPAIISSGETIFKRQCAACHREDGGGIIGPNLTDPYWLHGGSIAEIFHTIKLGVPDKGMISWEAVLSPEQMRDVATYIITLRGSNPENPKEPQGDLYEGDI